MANKSSYVICKHIVDLAKGPVEIQGPGFTLGSPGVKEVRIHATIFQKDGCNGCGVCCSNYDTCFFENELDYISSPDRLTEFKEKNLPIEAQDKLMNLLQEHDIQVNGVVKHIYVVPPLKPKEIELYHRKNRPACRWIIPRETGEKHCSIHPIRSITCGFPHLTITPSHQYRRDYTVIAHRQYGRNHQLGCEVPIGRKYPQQFDQETFDTDIYWLKRLNEVADYIGVTTWLPEVIAYLLDHVEDFKKGNYPKFDNNYEYISIKNNQQNKLF